jgi:hypothetical protein
MKQIMYGTVSALALMLAVHGVAKAQSSSFDEQSATAKVSGKATIQNNISDFSSIANSNQVEDNAFAHATGAFNVLQNQSINSAVQQGMAIGAVVNKDGNGQPQSDNDTRAKVHLDGKVGGYGEDVNSAFAATINGDNEIETNAFSNAAGAFNVLQNASTNSTVQQGMSIAAVINNGGDAFDDDPADLSAKAKVKLHASVTGNDSTEATINGGISLGDGNGNSLEDNAFQHAKGAFNVLQNQSINSSVQQGMAISAQVNRIDLDDASDDSDSSRTRASAKSSATAYVKNNTAGTYISPIVLNGQNGIEDNAFESAKGAFNVMQNQSINSAVQQGMAISAVVNKDPDGGKGDTGDAFDLPGQKALSKVYLAATVSGNTATPFLGSTTINTNNLITNHAFENAAGAFNVLQNASVNSAVQQSMSISAVVNK